MEIIAQTTATKVSPRKVRLIADVIRNKPVRQALTMLSLTNKHGAYVLLKAVKSAVANAMHNTKVTEDNLVLYRLEINEGPALKRYHASTRVRTHPYKKK